MTSSAVVPPPRAIKPRRLALHAFLLGMAILWLFPLLWAIYTSFRPFDDTFKRGYISLPNALTLTTTSPPGRRPTCRTTSSTP